VVRNGRALHRGWRTLSVVLVVMITSIYAWVAKESDDDHNILAINNMALVTTKLRIANLAKRAAQHIASESGKTAVLVRFDHAIVIDEVKP